VDLTHIHRMGICWLAALFPPPACAHPLLLPLAVLLLAVLSY
jgi:hypothetical protein